MALILTRRIWIRVLGCLLGWRWSKGQGIVTSSIRVNSLDHRWMNRPWATAEMDSQRRWETDVERRGWHVDHIGQPSYRWGRPAYPHDTWAPPSSGSFWTRLELFSVGFVSRFTCWCRFDCLESMTVVPGMVFWINPPAFTYLPKLMEFISLNP